MTHGPVQRQPRQPRRTRRLVGAFRARVNGIRTLALSMLFGTGCRFSQLRTNRQRRVSRRAPDAGPGVLTLGQCVACPCASTRNRPSQALFRTRRRTHNPTILLRSRRKVALPSHQLLAPTFQMMGRGTYVWRRHLQLETLCTIRALAGLVLRQPPGCSPPLAIRCRGRVRAFRSNQR